MDNDTRILITEELTKYLNRLPSEKEIMNGQTDINIMAKVKEKQDAKKLKDLEEKLSKK